jgi:oligopeptide/dipeptide ABC transporter ATP-binding protein
MTIILSPDSTAQEGCRIMNTADRAPLIEVRNLVKYFDVKNKGKLHAVDDISFDIFPGETLGLVGESGCGKSTVGNVLIKLLPATGGRMLYRGKDILFAKESEIKEYRKKMQIIFQDPYSSLNPKKTVKHILREPYVIHRVARGKALDERIAELCAMTGISPDLLKKYPHELDGGVRQIVGIARALSLSPEFIVCDEPVSSLDVSIQATIINLLMDLQKKLGLAYLFISHDLSVVRHISNRIAVMYLGKMAEAADTDEMFENPRHPYTIALLSAVPRIDTANKISRIVLKGDVTSPVNPKEGCRFASRCWMARDLCTRTTPEFKEIAPGHQVACHFHEESMELAKKLERKA